MFDEKSEILILGSFPSVKSREEGFYYGHPRNRFWKVLAGIKGEPIPCTAEEKREFLLSNRIAVWDVIGSCEIEGSSDMSIRNALPNDIEVILRVAQIRAIFVNGKTAQKYYNRFLLPVTGREATYLPSTSPANAAWSDEALVREWKRLTGI